jgi:hypothetical protein
VWLFGHTCRLIEVANDAKSTAIWANAMVNGRYSAFRVPLDARAISRPLGSPHRLLVDGADIKSRP